MLNSNTGYIVLSDTAGGIEGSILTKGLSDNKWISPTTISSKQQTYYLTELPTSTTSPYAEHDQVVVNNKDIYVLETIDGTLNWVKKYSIGETTIVTVTNLSQVLSDDDYNKLKNNDVAYVKYNNNIYEKVSSSDFQLISRISGDLNFTKQHSLALSSNKTFTHGLAYIPLTTRTGAKGYLLAKGDDETANKWVDPTTILTSIDGYDSTKTQVLKNISGTFQWVEEP